MQFNTYGGNGASLAVALVNTADHRPAALEGLLAAHEIQRPELDAPQAAELAAWARRLAPVFGERDPHRQAQLVNAMLAEAASRPQVSLHDGRPAHLHYISDHADTAARVRAVTASGVAHAICQAGGERLNRCEREGCAVVFLDTSRNGRRRFCSVRCANRVNVAAHRARRADPAGGR
ncbi:CGNR zinc finger domain-containing protein [Allonocardiopsis opalescens]|uniref:CGNR zinc finger protein n=1 Tax=Allonocardiopsis opalescens TaxID=1144618 RepID=A0A2T0QCJ8_9ACTN|nr:CGNR zinc finger domain-containing protein [Allonocardiopsis opalescens]PRY01674.1 CGNR zinc finger protein [Allonocardiopsis opalescens]